MRSEELITRLIARSSGRLWRKRIQVQPVRKACIDDLVGLAGDHAGPVGGNGGQIDLRGTVRVVPVIHRLKWRPRLPKEEHVTGPTLREQRQCSTRVSAKCKRVGPS